MSPRRHAFAAAAFVAGMSFGVDATAQPGQAGDPAAADALFRRGREAAERGDWAGACPKFAESQRLDPAPGTLLNLADCEEHMGQLATSYEHFKTAVETMGPSDDRIPFAKQHMASVEKRVPHLTLNASAGLSDRARVMRDDVQLGSASFGVALPVDPGTHAVVVRVPGHVDRRVVVTLKPGDAQMITLAAGEVESTAAASVAPLAPNVAPSTPERPGRAGTNPARVIGVVLGVAGIAGVGVGGVAGAFVLSKKSIVDDPSHCDQVTHACDRTGTNAARDGRTLSAASTVGFAAGAALLVAGVIALAVGGSGDGGKGGSHAAAALAVPVPEAYPGGGGLSVVGKF
jgi:hypothetical protein